jgi:hypothetical protein
LPEFAPYAIYLRALIYHVYLDDEQKAGEELAKLGDIMKSPVPDVLELYLDVFDGSLPEVRKLELVNAIIAKAKRRSEKLQYVTI